MNIGPGDIDEEDPNFDPEPLEDDEDEDEE